MWNEQYKVNCQFCSLIYVVCDLPVLQRVEEKGTAGEKLPLHSGGSVGLERYIWVRLSTTSDLLADNVLYGWFITYLTI